MSAEANVAPVSSSFRLALGKAIAAERVRSGLTQVQLAERMNWSTRHQQRIENAESTFDVDLLPELCDVLGCGLADLVLRIGGSDRRKLRLPRRPDSEGD